MTKKKHSHHFGFNLRKLIQRSGFSVSQVYKRIGVPKSTFYDWLESKTRPVTNIEHFYDLANLLRVDFDTIVFSPKERVKRDRGRNIVLIDDDQTARTIVAKRLQDKFPAADIQVFSNAALALDWFLSHECVLLISDYRMPIHNGVEVIKAWRMMLMDSETPAFILTADAYRSEISTTDIKVAKISGVLTKPFRVDDLGELNLGLEFLNYDDTDFTEDSTG